MKQIESHVLHLYIVRDLLPALADDGILLMEKEPTRHGEHHFDILSFNHQTGIDLTVQED